MIVPLYILAIDLIPALGVHTTLYTSSPQTTPGGKAPREAVVLRLFKLLP